MHPSKILTETCILCFPSPGIFSYQLPHPVLAQIAPVLLSVLESPDSDLVVAMTAVSSLGMILAVDGFLESKLLTAPDIVRVVSVLCVVTTKRLEEEETRERVITVVKDLLNSLGKSFFSDMEVFGALTYHLSSLWGCSEPTSPLRVTIIEVSTHTHFYSLPMVQLCFALLYLKHASLSLFCYYYTDSG
jgi:hypothetical protein